MATGVDGDATLRANRDGFGRYQLRVRRLIDVRAIDMSVALFGTKWDSPIVIAPVGSQRAFHQEGELATARAARAGRASADSLDDDVDAVWKTSSPRAASRCGSSSTRRTSGRHARPRQAGGGRRLPGAGADRRPAGRLESRDAGPPAAPGFPPVQHVPRGRPARVEPRQHQGAGRAKADVRRAGCLGRRHDPAARHELGLRQAPPRRHDDEARHQGPGHEARTPRSRCSTAPMG